MWALGVSIVEAWAGWVGRIVAGQYMVDGQARAALGVRSGPARGTRRVVR